MNKMKRNIYFEILKYINKVLFLRSIMNFDKFDKFINKLENIYKLSKTYCDNFALHKVTHKYNNKQMMYEAEKK